LGESHLQNLGDINNVSNADESIQINMNLGEYKYRGRSIDL
jgi:hypothetical protein